MLKISFNDIFKKPIVLALGFFDCVHQGHKKVISEAIERAKIHNSLSAVFTFLNNPATVLGKNDSEVMTFAERAEIFFELGVDVLIYSSFDEQFKNLSKAQFVSLLRNNFNISAVVAGPDYTFGKNAEGNLNDLRDAGFKVYECTFLTKTGEKISTTSVKKALEEGNIPLVNELLGRRYSLTSVVVKEREIGRTIGFPTANFNITGKKLPHNAVYDTTSYIDDKAYKSITNVGSKPTFNENKISVETYLLNFQGDLYGKTLKVEFINKIRDIQAFSSPEELKARLTKDKNNREGKPF